MWGDEILRAVETRNHLLFDLQVNLPLAGLLVPCIPFRIANIRPTHPVVECLIGSCRKLSTSFLSWHLWRLVKPVDRLLVAGCKSCRLVILNSYEKLINKHFTPNNKFSQEDQCVHVITCALYILPCITAFSISIPALLEQGVFAPVLNWRESTKIKILNCI